MSDGRDNRQGKRKGRRKVPRPVPAPPPDVESREATGELEGHAAPGPVPKPPATGSTVHVRCPRCRLEFDDEGRRPIARVLAITIAVLLLAPGGVAGAGWWIDRGGAKGPFFGERGPDGPGEVVPNVEVADRRIREGDEGTTDAIFRVTLSSPAEKRITVGYETEDGTALADTDYEPASGTLTFAAGDTNRKVTVPIIGDIEDEPDETFFVQLLDSPEIALSDPEGIGTIRDNDVAPVSIDPVSLFEGDEGTTNLTFELTADLSGQERLNLEYATTDGTAVAQKDYLRTNGTLTLTSQDPNATVAVPVIGDTIPEPDETFDLLLREPGSDLILVRATGTIRDDDGTAVTITIQDADPVVEGAQGTTTEATFVVTLSSPPGGPVTATYETVSDSAVAGKDFEEKSGSLTFTPPEVQKSVTVTVIGDDFGEPTETFRVVLTGANAPIARSEGIATINDDDGPNMSITDQVSLPEGTGQTTDFVFEVTLDSESQDPIQVDYDTVPVGGGQCTAAVENEDYDPASGTLVFAEGETFKTITVVVFGDPDPEQLDCFKVQLSNAQGATIIEPGNGLGAIENDD